MNSNAPLIALCITFASVALAAPAQAEVAAPSPVPWLQKKVDEAKDLALRKVEAGTPAETKWQADTKNIIDELLNWEELTERSLGSQWKSLSAAEQKEFSGLLREMIETSYQSKLRLAARGNVKKPAKVTIDWAKEELDGQEATVIANVQADKTKMALEFSLIYSKGRWQVWDVAIDDVSTVRTYRSQFRKLISQEGFAALVDRIKAKITDIREGRADLGP